MHYAHLRVVPASLCILCAAVWTFAGALHDCSHLHADSRAAGGVLQSECSHSHCRHSKSIQSQNPPDSEEADSGESEDQGSEHCPVCDLLAQFTAISTPSVHVHRPEAHVSFDSLCPDLIAQTDTIELVNRGPPRDPPGITQFAALPTA